MIVQLEDIRIRGDGEGLRCGGGACQEYQNGEEGFTVHGRGAVGRALALRANGSKPIGSMRGGLLSLRQHGLKNVKWPAVTGPLGSIGPLWISD